MANYFLKVPAIIGIHYNMQVAKPNTRAGMSWSAKMQLGSELSFYRSNEEEHRSMA